MNTLSLVSDIVRQDGILLLIGIFLLLYRWTAHRSPRLHEIPLDLFLLYTWGRPVGHLLVHPALYPDWANEIQTGFDILLSWGWIRLGLYVVVEWPRHRSQRSPLARITRDFLLAILFTASAFILMRTRGNVNLVGILTTSAVLTAVIGLAMQTTLSNFFAGLAIQFERPFGLGDWLIVGDNEGEVISITWKSTRLLTRDSHMLYLPNSTLITGSFRVLTQPTPDYTVKFLLGVEYDAPPNKVRQAVLEVLSQQLPVQLEPAPEVRLKTFGDFAIFYEIRFTFRTPRLEHIVVGQIHNALWYALKRNGIRIPYPIREIQHAHIERRRLEQSRLSHLIEIENMLAGVPFLSALQPADRARVAREAPCRTYAEGEIIISKGDKGDSLFIVLEGSCAVRTTEGGNAKTFAKLLPGDCFGEMSLLTGDPRTATVYTERDTRVLEIGKDLFSTVLNANPDIAVQLAELLTQRRKGLLSAGESKTESGADSGGLLTRIRRFFGL